VRRCKNFEIGQRWVSAHPPKSSRCSFARSVAATIGRALFYRRGGRFLLKISVVSSGHRAAIALVGWFLISAPVSNHGAIIYQDAPLSQWTKVQHLDSEADCDAARKDLIQDSQDEVELAPDSVADADTKEHANNVLNEALASECVADDDPRLQSSKLPQVLGPGMIKRLAH
jgi:hypothetical protein